MKVGIEKLDLYAGRLALNFDELAAARGRDAAQMRAQIMCESRSIFPPYEDAVTLAVNAARRLLTGRSTHDIALLLVSTESSVDFGKPISTWVHRFCGLPTSCRNMEVKHACYGGPGALRLAASHVAAGLEPGKKALVISADYSRLHLDDGYEFALGGCAAAMLVGGNAEVLALDLERAGYWTHEVADTFRPTSRVETGDNQTSLYSYLDALDGASASFEGPSGAIDYRSAFARQIYHAPFPGMALHAHRTLLARCDVTDRRAVDEDFDRRVRPSLHFAKRIGSAYGASNFVCLLGLLQSDETVQPGDRIGIFAYGSGCQGELYCGSVGTNARALVDNARIDEHLDERRLMTVAEYEQNERARTDGIDCPFWRPNRTGDPLYEEMYRGRGLLVLDRVDNYYRHYDWS